MKYTVVSPETEQCLAVVDYAESRGEGSWHVARVDNGAVASPVALGAAPARFNNGVLELQLPGPEGGRNAFPAFRGEGTAVLTVATHLGSIRLLASRGTSLGAGAGARTGVRNVKSSMPGKVIKVLCKAGDRVEAGQPLVILEAMKMENEIRSPQAGVVGAVPVAVGQKVESGEMLVKLEGDK